MDAKSTLEKELKNTGFNSIDQWYRQVFRNYGYSTIKSYGDSEEEQLYNRLVEVGVLKVTNGSEI